MLCSIRVMCVLVTCPKMPGIEDKESVFTTDSAASKDFASRDMDELVSEIKENLRLSGLKASGKQKRLSRPSPYKVPSRGLNDPNCETCVKSPNRQCLVHSRCKLRLKSGSSEIEDPYEKLQDLLRNGCLIKEAVRRLQIGLASNQRFFRESDEESSRSPNFHVRHSNLCGENMFIT